MKLDRDYFKKKENPTYKAKKSVTPCCKIDISASEPLNKNNEAHWEMMEEYAERQLFDYHHMESIEPRCCKKCGRLIEYVTTFNDKAWKK